MQPSAWRRLDSAELSALHQAVLQGNQGARATISTHLLSSVYRVLLKKMPAANRALLNDAVEDSIVAYLQRPDSYDATRSRLDTFIAVAASHRALNALRSEKRRLTAEERFRKCLVSIGSTAIETEHNINDTTGADLIRAIVVNPLEHRFLIARLAGFRRTTDLARVLGVLNLPIGEQRQEVKRLTERLRARLRRLRR